MAPAGVKGAPEPAGVAGGGPAGVKGIAAPPGVKGCPPPAAQSGNSRIAVALRAHVRRADANARITPFVYQRGTDSSMPTAYP